MSIITFCLEMNNPPNTYFADIYNFIKQNRNLSPSRITCHSMPQHRKMHKPGSGWAVLGRAPTGVWHWVWWHALTSGSRGPVWSWLHRVPGGHPGRVCLKWFMNRASAMSWWRLFYSRVVPGKGLFMRGAMSPNIIEFIFVTGPEVWVAFGDSD